MNAYKMREKSQPKIAATKVIDQQSTFVKNLIIIRIEEPI